MDKDAMLKLRDQAEDKIKENPELMKIWLGSPWPLERELIMTQAIFEIVYARGYDDGFADGYEDGSLEYSA